jgi:tetratricopeptide (TPR) repeat protein
MRFRIPLLVFLLCAGSCAIAQQQPQADDKPTTRNDAPPRSDQDQGKDADAGQSSSRDTQVDLSAPKDDAKNHPNSHVAISDPDEEPAAADVQEMHPFNPYRALKDDEVGDFYMKRKSYRAALARYQDALIWKENDAVANFRMAQCYEKLDQPDDAITHYQEYLKILPDGPFAKDARKALEKLKASEAKNEALEKNQSKP